MYVLTREFAVRDVRRGDEALRRKEVSSIGVMGRLFGERSTRS